ncbi:hypothetical protein [Spiroplasma endosymbiont of Ammophila pubescens]|uniref:hypothetical protein n=1 Tax=Spiroplasma endosymbiont of Ammophila pubescens TaxID=3066315 RepID=UPI0032B27868
MKQDKTTWLKGALPWNWFKKDRIPSYIIELIKILENEKENIKFVVELLVFIQYYFY